MELEREGYCIVCGNVPRECTCKQFQCIGCRGRKKLIEDSQKQIARLRAELEKARQLAREALAVWSNNKIGQDQACDECVKALRGIVEEVKP